MNKNVKISDVSRHLNENLPKSFIVHFKEKNNDSVRITVDDVQIGDVIDDNSYEKDFYRYHDVFHYTFATLLDWSPCTRAMLKRKRKSIPIVDAYEDGARATITEEAISLILFNEAKRTNYFEKGRVSKTLLKIIKQMTEPFEVRNKTEKEWESAILKGYQLFKKLVQNRGGKIKFDACNKQIMYIG